MDRYDLEFLLEADDEYVAAALSTLFYLVASSVQVREADRVFERMLEAGAEDPLPKAIAWVVNEGGMEPVASPTGIEPATSSSGARRSVL